MTAIATPEVRESLREKIIAFESVMTELPQVFLETRHHFPEGLYAREISIPAGVMLTGAEHRFEHLNIVSKGCIEVVTEFGSERITAPATFVSKPGTKRVGYAVEDTVWTTIHANPDNCRDVAEIEKRLVLDADRLQTRRGIEEEDQQWLS